MEMQDYYRVGETLYFWLWERPEDRSPGYSSSTRVEQLKKARALAAETGLQIELRRRRRMNDYVGSPIWGEDHLVQIIPLRESRGRLGALAT